jgi:hydroxymethylglutaryl-CoA lyase
LDALTDIGFWISEKLGRENASRAGRALLAKRQREKNKLKEGAA